MYTRKQFLMAAAKECLDFARRCISGSSCFEADLSKTSESSSHASVFLEATGLGIDPGTMDPAKLSQAIRHHKKRQ